MEYTALTLRPAATASPVNGAAVKTKHWFWLQVYPEPGKATSLLLSPCVNKSAGVAMAFKVA